MSESDPIRAFVADDHAIVRKGIAAVLELVPDIEVVGEAENGRDAVYRVAELRPDVILMDLVMPVMDGIEAIRRIQEDQPEARILVLTTFAGEDQVLPAIKAGARPRSTPSSPARCWKSYPAPPAGRPHPTP
jgi:DNA-binding NarL/FixJ family response regulator